MSVKIKNYFQNDSMRGTGTRLCQFCSLEKHTVLSYFTGMSSRKKVLTSDPLHDKKVKLSSIYASLQFSV